jgi:hypothetical protein
VFISLHFQCTDLYYFVFVLFLQLVITTTSGYWSGWSEWSVCSRSCGGGVTYRLRQCIHNNEFKKRKGCRGKTIKYKTCNNKVTFFLVKFNKNGMDLYR